MATRSAVKKPKAQKNGGVLPQRWVGAIRRGSVRGTGAFLLILALALLIAIISYDAADPTFNRATGQNAENLLGSFGASMADLLLQIFGIAAILIILPLASFGYRIMTLDAPVRWRLHLLAWIIATPLLAVLCAAFPFAQGWPVAPGAGGTLGLMGYRWLNEILANLSIIAPWWAFALVFAVLGLPTWVYAMALTKVQWTALTLRSYRVFSVITKATWRLMRFLFTTPAPMDEDNVESAPVKKKPRKLLHRMKRDKPVEVELPKAPKTSKRAVKEREMRLPLGDGFELPALTLLAKAKVQEKDPALTKDALEANARMLEGVLDDFSVKGEIINVKPGPVVTLYELEPAPGIKSSRVIGLADDIARSMSAISARVAVIPGRNAIGIELPNARREMVFLRELLDSRAFEKNSGQLPMVLGKTIGGEPVIADLAPMPHLLVAGTTGSGKSVGINAMILSLLYRLTPEQCRFIMVDPKMLELSVYDGIPHLLAPVVTDPRKAVVALKWVVREMEDRYRKMSKLSVRNIGAFNEKVSAAKGASVKRRVHTGYDPESGDPIYETQEFEFEPLPLIVVVVDELADLMVVAGKEIEGAVQRLAQMARAAGIHLIMATQRPSVDVITGVIKANLPTRISFQVTSKIDSRTILESMGAEQLLGRGDMLFMQNGKRITRVHGPFVSDEEVERVVAHLKTQGRPDYVEDVTEETEDGGDPFSSGPEKTGDELYDRAVALVATEQKASTSFIQRHLQIGYNRAARLIEQMEKEGVVSAANHVGRREVLIDER
ncbi:MAG: DNA translocase FtsK 4TM domain-containing protein [Sphingomonadales bacterium]